MLNFTIFFNELRKLSPGEIFYLEGKNLLFIIIKISRLHYEFIKLNGIKSLIDGVSQFKNTGGLASSSQTYDSYLMNSSYIR